MFRPADHSTGLVQVNAPGERRLTEPAPRLKSTLRRHVGSCQEFSPAEGPALCTRWLLAAADHVVRAFGATQVELRRIAGAGHFVLWQRPEMVRDALATLLERSAVAPGASG